MIVEAATIAAIAFAERLRGGWPAVGESGSDEGAGRARALRGLIWLTVLAALVWNQGGAFACLAVGLSSFVLSWLSILNSHSDCWGVQDWRQAARMTALGVARGYGCLLPAFWFSILYGSLHRADVIAAAVFTLAPYVHTVVYAVAYRCRYRLPYPGGPLDGWNAYSEIAWGAYLGLCVVVLL